MERRVCRENLLCTTEKNPPENYAELLLSLRQALDRSKIYWSVLEDIKTHLGKEIRRLQRRCAPLIREDGIKRLPDELLAEIFEIGHHSSKSCEFSLAVSHVSRRFREISLRTPVLWTRFSPEYLVPQITAFIPRSAELDLEVLIQPEESVHLPDTEIFFELLGPLSSRWSRLSVCVNALLAIWTLGIHNFPRLRYLDKSLLSDMDQPILAAWKMQSLTHVRGSSWPVSLQSQFTCVEVVLTELEPLDTHALANAMYGLKKLQHLSVSLEDCAVAAEMSAQDLAIIPRPHSVNIDTLTIIIERCADKPVRALYDAFIYLRPSKTHMSINAYPYSPMETSKRIFFPYASTIRLDLHRAQNIPYLLRKIGDHCKIATLVHLETFSGKWDRPVDLTNIRFPHHLRLRNCHALSENVVEGLAKALLTAKGLESLEIISCKNISEDFLLNLRDEVGPKLTWLL